MRLCCALLISAAAFADVQSDGLAALDKGDFAKAKQLFTQAVQSDPKDYFALFNLAFAESALHEDANAIDHLKQVLTLKPGLAEAESNLGTLYIRNHQAGDAIPLLEDAAKQKASPRVWSELARAEDETGKHAEAQQHWSSAAQLDSKDAAIQLGWGESLLQSGQLDNAAEHIQAAVSADPKLNSFLGELADAYAKANRPDDALRFLQQLPPSPAVNEQIGNLLLKAGKPDEAAEKFRAAVEQSPTTANKLALATALLQTKHPESAEPLLAQALNENPNDYEITIAIAKLQLQKKDNEKAAALFLHAAKLKPDSVEAWRSAGVALIVSKHYPEGISALDHVRALGAEKPGDFYFRAVAFDSLHQPKPALASYQEFLKQSNGQFPDQEFLARHRSIALEHELGK